MANVRKWVLIAIALEFLVCVAHADSQSLTIRGDRWLAITELSGSVTMVSQDGSRRQASRGDRLSDVGDTLITGNGASARLEVDLQTGFITMAENSQLQVQALSITRSGGRITELLVTRGQVRLRVRPLTNPDTRLEIYTPAGVSGVRGTDFGVSIQLDGRTGVATNEGRVVARAQGQAVQVGADLQTTIVPGEPPTPPEPLRDDPTLFIEALSPIPGRSAVRIVGSTDEVNLLKIAEQPRLLDRRGHFDIEVSGSAAENRRIQAVVTTPLGTEQSYELVVP